MLKQKLKLFHIYKITWLDHFSAIDQGWLSIEEINEEDDEYMEENTSKVESIGFYVKSTKKWITLALNRGNDENCSCFMNILKSCIVDIKVINP